MTEPKKFIIYKLENPQDTICEEIQTRETKTEINTDNQTDTDDEEIENLNSEELSLEEINQLNQSDPLIDRIKNDRVNSKLVNYRSRNLEVDKVNLVTQNPRGAGDSGYLRLSRALIIGGGAAVDGKLTINSTATSTSPDTGAFIVSGGLGVKDNLNIGSTGPARVFPDISELPAASVGDSNISSENWTSVCWSPKLKIFCAVSLEGIIGRSSDGINWREVQIDPIRQLVNVCWSEEQELFCAVSNDKYVIISTNAIQWSEYTVPPIQKIVILGDKYIKITANTNPVTNLPSQINISKGLYTPTELVNYLNSQITNYITNNNLSNNLNLSVKYDNFLESNPSNIFSSNRFIFKGKYNSSSIILNFYNSSNNNLDNAFTNLIGYSGTQISISNIITGGFFDIAGINSPIITTISDMNLSCIAWAPSLNVFCILSKIVLYNTIPICAVFTSSNGVSWTRTEMVYQSNWNSITWSTYDGGTFCAVSTGINSVTYSNDGINWKVPDLSTSVRSNNWVSICWSENLQLFCSVADNNTSNRCIMISVNANNWSVINSPVNSRKCITWSSELKIFCALGLNTKNSIISTDGINWTIKFSSGDSIINKWNCIAYSPLLRKLCGITQIDSKVLIITDDYKLSSAALTVEGGMGVKGNTILLDDTQSTNYTSGALIVKGGVGIGGNLNVGGTLEMGYLRVKEKEQVATNPLMNLIDRWVVYDANIISGEWNGILWSTVLQRFYAVGNNVLVSSPDGINWTNLTFPSNAINKNWKSIAWHNASEQIYAISDRDIINTYDGTNWNLVNLPNSFYINYINVNSTKYIYIKHFPILDTLPTRSYYAVSYSPTYHFNIINNNYLSIDLVSLCPLTEKIYYDSTTYLTTVDGYPATVLRNYILKFYLSLTYENNKFKFTGYLIYKISDSYAYDVWTIYTRIRTAGEIISETTTIITDCYVEIRNSDNTLDTNLYSKLGFSSNTITNLPAISSTQIIFTPIQNTQPVVYSDITTSNNILCITTKSNLIEANPFISSPDGINWNYSNPSLRKNWNAISWSSKLNLFCAVSSADNCIAISTDGINWSFINPSQDIQNNNWVSICWSSYLNLFCVVANNNTAKSCVMISSDGLNWNLISTPLNSRSYIIWHEILNYFYAIDYNSNIVMFSSDGIIWDTENMIVKTDSIVNNLWKKITYSPDLYLVCGLSQNNSTVLISNNKYDFISGSIIKGGLGIEKNLIVSDNSETSDIFTGSIIANGGIAAKKSINVGIRCNFLNEKQGGPTIGTVGGDGTKITLYPGTESDTPYAFGTKSNTLWYGVPNNASHVFYNKTNEIVRFNSVNTDSVNSSSGTVVVKGGLGISGNSTISNNLKVQNQLFLNSSIINNNYSSSLTSKNTISSPMKKIIYFKYLDIYVGVGADNIIYYSSDLNTWNFLLNHNYVNINDLLISNINNTDMISYIGNNIINYISNFKVYQLSEYFDSLSIKISSDGTTIVLGIYKYDQSININPKGRVFIFNKNSNGIWPDLANAKFYDGQNLGDRLGDSCSISNDGSTILVNAYGYNNYDGIVYIISKNPDGTWPTNLTNANQTYNGSGVMSRDGSTVVIDYSGNKYIINKNANGTWPSISNATKIYIGLGISSNSGYKAYSKEPFTSISNNGADIIVTNTSYNNSQGIVYIISKNSDGVWPSSATSYNGTGLGVMSRDGSTVVIDYSGNKYIINKNANGTWPSISNATKIYTGLGGSLNSISNDGSTIIVTNTSYNNNQGIAYIISKNSDGVWPSNNSDIRVYTGTQNSYFGYSTVISNDGSTIFINDQVGVAYIINKLKNGTWPFSVNTSMSNCYARTISNNNILLNERSNKIYIYEFKPLSISYNYKSFIMDDSKFVSIGYNSTNSNYPCIGYSSSDFKIWTDITTSNLSAAQWISIVYSPYLNLYSAVSLDGKIAISSDLINWNIPYTNSIYNLRNIIWVSNFSCFYIIGNTISSNSNKQTVLIVSSDGLNWSVYQISSLSLVFSDIQWVDTYQQCLSFGYDQSNTANIYFLNLRNITNYNISNITSITNSNSPWSRIALKNNLVTTVSANSNLNNIISVRFTENLCYTVPDGASHNFYNGTNSYITMIKGSQYTMEIKAPTGSVQKDWPAGWSGGLQTFDITCAGIYYNVFAQRSDIRNKKDIIDLNYGLNEIIQLRPVSYYLINNDSEIQYGFIAQEVEQIIPEMVGEDSNGFKNIKNIYTPIIVNAIKELNEKIEIIQNQIETVQNENQQLKEKIQKIMDHLQLN